MAIFFYVGIHSVCNIRSLFTVHHNFHCVNSKMGSVCRVERAQFIYCLMDKRKKIILTLFYFVFTLMPTNMQ